MKKDDCDRIIVESNEKMEKVIRWYLSNKNQLDKAEFHAPIENGCIILQEENIEVTFESKGETAVEISVYPRCTAIPALTYDYNPHSQTYGNYRYPSHISSQKRRIMEAALKYDRTDYKEAIKYHSLMMLSAYYKEVVTVDESKSKARTKHEAKKLRKSSNQPLPLVRKTYIVKDFEENSLRKLGEKRAYTKPDYEVHVKGFYRTSKKGKKTWIKPFSRYSDKENKMIKEYKL